MNNPRHKIALTGCAPTPMAAYLKALGVLRLVGDADNPEGDGQATSWWSDDVFNLRCQFSKEELVAFFLKDYAPSPVVAPWNGGSGFYPKDNRTAIQAITQGSATRFQIYRHVIHACEKVLQRLNIESKVDLATKPLLLQACRNSLPDQGLEWLDAAFLLTEDGPKYPPLLGTGGNDGRLDFTNNFMQRLCELFDLETGQPRAKTEAWLREALFEEPTDELQSDSPVGQFDPGGAGGANSRVGFSSKPLLNPWNYVLMLEGAMVFASAAAKKLESRAQGTLAYPFCVRSIGVGYGSASDEDETSARAEMWLPLWKQASTLMELRSLFAEGRAQVRKRPAKNAVDFARALATFGVDRGIAEFVRYGFHQRNGLAYFAVPLNRFVVRGQPEVNLIQTVDHWLERFRRGAVATGAPSSAGWALRQLESAIMELCQRTGPERVQDVAVALGEAEAVLVRSASFRKDNSLSPLVLSPEWLPAMDDGSTEFRLAASLAGIWDKRIGAFREHLEPVDKGPYVKWLEETSPKVVWGIGGLLRKLVAVLNRRVVEAIQQGPSDGQAVMMFPGDSLITASLGDVHAFLEGKVDLNRLESLLKGLALLDWPKLRNERKVLKLERGPSEPMPSAVYAFLKLTHLSSPLVPKKGSAGIPIRLSPSVSRLAASNRLFDATNEAVRRLRSSGLPPLVGTSMLPAEDVERLVASLLFCISPISARRLAKRVIDLSRVDDNELPIESSER